MAFQVPVLADFRALFPELATSVADTQFQFWLTQSAPIFDQDRWDDLLFLGMLYWIAHSATLGSANATQQTFDDSTTKKVGDIMKSRSDKLMQLQADNPYYRTTYGQQYLYYQQLVGMGGFAV